MTQQRRLQVHTIYRSRSGDRLPSVTTVLGILNKPALVHWAWELGTQSIDYRKVRDSAGDIGTLAHYLIMCYVKDEEPDTSDYSLQDITRAAGCLARFAEWADKNTFKLILSEKPLVSEIHRYGGTVDLLVEQRGERILYDVKTGSGVYDENYHQVAAYYSLLNENGHHCDSVKIIHVDKDEPAGLHILTATNLDKHFELFLHCLGVYRLQGQLTRRNY